MDEQNNMPLEMIFGNYMSWKLDEKTWIISFMDGTEYIYLLEGDEMAMLIDTGYGIGHLRDYVEKLTDKPVVVVNTHFHPDHAAGNDEWEEVLLSSGWPVDVPSLDGGRYPRDPEGHRYPDYRKTIVHDGEVIELGGRRIRVLEALPAHCNSSLFFVDEGHWYLLPNHNGTPISIAYLDDYIGLADAIFAGTAVIEDKLNHRYIEKDPKAPELCRVRFGACSIFIKKAEVLKIYGTKA